jgi:hypothetical protein
MRIFCLPQAVARLVAQIKLPQAVAELTPSRKLAPPVRELNAKPKLQQPVGEITLTLQQPLQKLPDPVANIPYMV